MMKKNVLFEWVTSYNKGEVYVVSNVIWQQLTVECIGRRFVYILGDAFNIRRWSFHVV